DLPPFEAILSADERTRADRFVNLRDRRRYLVARGCLRRLLGEYLGLAPDAVALAATDLGKPHLTQSDIDLRFNVAHSEELPLFAFACGREIGVDLERERPDVDWRDLARRFFAPQEVAALTTDVGPFDRCEAFYRCWARK